MARNEITFLVNVRKNTNTASKTYGQYYGFAAPKAALSLRGFAKHVSDHGRLVDYDLMVLVLRNIISCLKEMICQGQPVKLDGLGTFYPSIEGTGAASPESYDPQVNIEGVHLRYLPEGEKDDNITSRELKKQCIFEMNDLVQTFTKVIDGKKKTYQVRKKISTLSIENADADDPATDPDPEIPEP